MAVEPDREPTPAEERAAEIIHDLAVAKAKTVVEMFESVYGSMHLAEDEMAMSILETGIEAGFLATMMLLSQSHLLKGDPEDPKLIP